MRMILAALALLLAAPRAHAVADEAALRTAGDSVLSMSDADYRDLAKANADARWAKLDRSKLLNTIYSKLAAARFSAAKEAGLDPELTKAGRSLSDDARSASVDPELLQQTGWAEDLQKYVRSYMPPEPRRPAAVAAVRGGRKLSTGADKEVSALLASIDAGDRIIVDDATTPTKRAQTHYDAALAYKKIALLATAPNEGSATGKDREADLRGLGNLVFVMSDEDFREFAKKNPDARWSQLERPAMLTLVYRSLSALRFQAVLDGEPDPAARSKAQAALSSLTNAGRSVSDDAKAAAPDADLLQQTGWISNFVDYVNADPVYRPRLSAVSDKEVARLLETVDAGDQVLADPATTPARRAEVDYKAALAYQSIAALIPAAAKTVEAAPPAAVAKGLSAKEIYQKDAPSVVLILGSGAGGQGELGTGSVIDAEGRILTNAHVVIDDRTGAPFPTLRVYRKPARVTGDTKRDLIDPVTVKVARFDRALDLALLEPAKRLGLAPIALGDDSEVAPGDPVVAIGHPEQGGLWTLTQGVVSTVVADLGGVAGKDVFQTDASINRGNSGGPLLDHTGTIVGVNTSMARKAADGLTITSVNFSIKSSVARRWLAGDAPAVAAAPAQQPPAAQPVPVAVTPTPPAPKTKPVVVTPAKPYRIDDILEAQKEMEDMGREMSDEIHRRMQLLQH